MTLILALPCRDGIVLASDGKVQRFTDGQWTSYTAQKIFKFGKNKLWGCAGAEPDLKKFEKKINNLSDEEKGISLADEEHLGFLDKFANCDEETARRKECSEFLVVEYTKYPMAWRRTADTMQGVFYNGSDKLFDGFSSLGVGSGQLVAEIVLRNINYQLILEEGVLAAYRILKEAIKMGNFRVGEPIDIWTIRRGKVKHIEKETEINRIKESYGTLLAGERFAFTAASLTL
jgi:hypothetical protein